MLNEGKTSSRGHIMGIRMRTEKRRDEEGNGEQEEVGTEGNRLMEETT